MLVAAIGETPEELLSNEESIKQVQISAAGELSEMGTTETVLLYVVNEGLKERGLRFETLEESLAYLRLPRDES